MRFSKNWFMISLGLLVTEIVIGVFVNDPLIRPYGGDFLMVILLYSLLRTFSDLQVWKAACSVLLFSYFVEWLQYLKLADRLHLPHHSLARILLGDYFTWTDIVCYTLGILTVFTIEKMNKSGIIRSKTC